MTTDMRDRPLIPIPGLSDEDLRKLTRQQRYKLRRYADGVCTCCGKMPRCEASKTLCAECLSLQRERMRQRAGSRRRNLRSKSYASIDAAVGRPTAVRSRPRRPATKTPPAGAGAKA